MPWINKAQKPKQIKRYFSNREGRQEIYNTATWRNLRKAHLQYHPLCYMCQQKGIIKGGDQVHHLISPFQFQGLKRNELAYDADNLITLCSKCHSELHGQGKEATLQNIYYQRKQAKNSH